MSDKKNEVSFFFLILLLLVITISSSHAQVIRQEQEGVMWKKTLRIQGLISRMDPFNETSLYGLSEVNVDSMKTQRSSIQFELVASKFWEALKDSIISGIKTNRVDVHLLKGDPQRPNIYFKGTKITSYNVLLNELYLGFQKAIDATDTRNQKAVYVLEPLGPQIMLERIAARNVVKSKEDVLKLLTLYQLEVIFSVDETGFKIEPMSLLLGSAHFSQIPIMEENQDFALLKDYYNLFDRGFGFFVDLTSPLTYSFLVETGVMYSGEGNIIPFYDLVTMFHYPYEYYSESDFVIAGRTDQDEIKRLMMDRYNETTFNNLYGQPPQWWEAYGKSQFMNGIFDIDTTKQRIN